MLGEDLSWLYSLGFYAPIATGRGYEDLGTRLGHVFRDLLDREVSFGGYGASI